MRVHMITWNFNKQGALYNQSRDRLLARLKNLPNHTDSNLETFRIVGYNGSADDLYKYLKDLFDSNDAIFVSELFAYPQSYGGWFNKATWEWIEKAFRS